MNAKGTEYWHRHSIMHANSRWHDETNLSPQSTEHLLGCHLLPWLLKCSCSESQTDVQLPARLVYHCKNKLDFLTTEWLPWLQENRRDSGYERFTLVLENNCKADQTGQHWDKTGQHGDKTGKHWDKTGKHWDKTGQHWDKTGRH